MLAIFSRLSIWSFLTVCLATSLQKAGANTSYVCIPSVGSRAPSFTAESTEKNISFPQDFRGRWIVLFSFPNVFAPVCSSEVAAFCKERKNMEAAVLGISANSRERHVKWLKNLERQKTVSSSRLPLISDPGKKNLRRYGMLHVLENREKPLRAVYFIDPKGLIRAVFFYPFFNGRSVTEISRLLAAMQLSDKEKKVTPEGWRKGDKGIKCPQCSQGQNCFK